ncbi:Herc2 [Symbiodinium sp. CCMP2456]|nr:Herc2 [Symbiodinium sp. CCMP2456]
MGMPTLKRFARPLDWTQIEAVLRRYGQLVATDQAMPQQALPPVMIRFPGESRRHVRARSATVSSPFDRKGPEDPVYLYLHMENFQDPGQRPPPRLEGLDEDALSSLPIPPPLATPRALGEDKEQMTPAAAPKRRARQRRSRGPRQ